MRNAGAWTDSKVMIRQRVLCASALGLCLIGGVLALALRIGRQEPHASRGASGTETPSNVNVAANSLTAAARADSFAPDPATVPAQIESLPGNDRRLDLTRQLLKSIADTNPAVAAQMAFDQPGSFRGPLLAAVLSVWGSNAPLNAVEWVKALPESPAKQGALLSLASAWATADPVAAADYAVHMNPSQTQLSRLAAARWAERDVTSAISWADQLAAGEARDHFLLGLSDTLVENSPGDAARLIASMGPGPAQADAAVTVVMDWMRSDPENAGAWLVSFPSGPVRERAVEESLGVLAEVNPGAAQRLLDGLPAGPERDQAVRQFVSLVQSSNPAVGAGALTTIEDPALRREETERLAQHWLMVDPVAARAWLAEAALPEETKANLLAAHGF